MIAELEAAFLRACPSFEADLAHMREDYKIMGFELNLTTVLDRLGFHLGASLQRVPSTEILQVLKVVERVLVDGGEQQKWAVTHFLLPSLQSSIRQKGNNTDALLTHLGPASAQWWNDLVRNPRASEDW